MIISRKRYEAEIAKKVDEALCKCEERFWRDDREREKEKFMADLERRLIALEKKNGIDHPSHHRGETCTAGW